MLKFSEKAISFKMLPVYYSLIPGYTAKDVQKLFLLPHCSCGLFFTLRTLRPLQAKSIPSCYKGYHSRPVLLETFYQLTFMIISRLPQEAAQTKPSNFVTISFNSFLLVYSAILQLKRAFTVRLVKHRSRAPRGVVKSPFLEILKFDLTWSCATCSGITCLRKGS